MILTSDMSCDIYTSLVAEHILMSEDFSILIYKEYPGRLIIIGRDLLDENDVIVYAITGRSVSSQARRIEITEEGAWVKPTNEKVLREGNSDLLIYPAILFWSGSGSQQWKADKGYPRSSFSKPRSYGHPFLSVAPLGV